MSAERPEGDQPKMSEDERAAIAAVLLAGGPEGFEAMRRAPRKSSLASAAAAYLLHGQRDKDRERRARDRKEGADR